jgi:hypothetical protein
MNRKGVARSSDFHKPLAHLPCQVRLCGRTRFAEEIFRAMSRSVRRDGRDLTKVRGNEAASASSMVAVSQMAVWQ